ncbi:MAG: aminotransferase class I/II-fold pyridoxal phosphate-dependent enzyme [Lachnobacterium sp.]|nr:aminotransferase class I/II-fold pyridoxal phosphate-dependent enzyme [Lachnobacterium sp.]
MIEQKLKALAQSDVYPFHMPGHKRQLSGFFPYELDITEIEGFDNLHHAKGLLFEAQQYAAQMYQSRKAYYLVNGSTCGILAAISAATTKGGRVLVARNCHKAVYNAIYLRGLKAEYVYPVATHYGIQGQIQAADVERKLVEKPDIQAIVITSPTYDGLVSDVRAIADLAHAHGIPLIVDEAHGAHFGLDEAFPDNATVLGADAVIMSVHKTLPAPTQTAILHLCSDRINVTKMEKFLGIYETSSPSYVLMAGIEESLRLADEAKGVQMKEYVRRLQIFREKMRRLTILRVPDRADFTGEEAYAYDIGKLLLVTNGAISGKALQELLLKKYGLQMEMSSGNYVLAMTSFMDTEEGLERLADALLEIDATLTVTDQREMFSPEKIYRQPKKAMEIDEVQDGESTSVAFSEAEGRICADYIYLYPPGIPVIVPGEVLDQQTLTVIETCQKMELDVEGLPQAGHVHVVNNF